MTYTAQDLVAQARAVIEEINAERLLAMQASGLPVIDVREPEEFTAGHLPGAVNIPRGVLEFQVDGHPALNFRNQPSLVAPPRAGDPLLQNRRPFGAGSRSAETAGLRSPHVVGRWLSAMDCGRRARGGRLSMAAATSRKKPAETLLGTQMQAQAEQAAELLKALSNPQRLRVMSC